MGFDRLLDAVRGGADRRAIAGGQLAELFHQLGDLALLAEELGLRGADRLLVGERTDHREKLVAELVEALDQITCAHNKKGGRLGRRTVAGTSADYALTKIPSCNGTLAVCGFCWGGGVTFAYANENPKLKAAYSFYGTAPDSADKVKNIACPVYGFYAENDERVNATISKAEELMKAAGKTYEPVIYKGAGHGFMRSGEPTNPAVREADRKARDEAWARWKDLLKQL